MAFSEVLEVFPEPGFVDVEQRQNGVVRFSQFIVVLAGVAGGMLGDLLTGESLCGTGNYQGVDA